MVVPYINFILILLCVTCFLFSYRSYRKYYELLLTNHKEEFIRLVKKDKLIEAAGEWVRWPVGSAWVLLSVFDLKEFYNDNAIRECKKRFTIYFVLFIVLFAISFLTSLWMT